MKKAQPPPPGCYRFLLRLKPSLRQWFLYHLAD
ncbi:MAG: hypothetical protein [Podoviridae sp. cty5g4]|nr:MAG: hypothetical protein [Podoviridae sp. cty5g4]